ncbi:aldose 1-epimerase family protein [Flavicella sediminum]|uniref:aldose 1-epimerase family protein n=1 Tax=Flavicella sediminum TaxID=2585141 RepID=UPI0011204805|nr:aldose 1-epimerase family protein [Flavicella sediminum]
MNSLKNEFLEIKIKDTGSELASIIANGKQYLWEGNPTYWGGQAPILFPFVGRFKNDEYFYQGKKYTLPQHGFYRRSNAIKLINKTANSLSYSLKSCDESLKVYPFHFEIINTYKIDKNTITIEHKVKNTGSDLLYFSIGEHPAFKCSLENPNESFENCTLEFEKTENAVIHLIENGLISNTTEPCLNNSNSIELDANSFEKDALVFKKMNSKKVSLIHKNEGKLVTLRYADFPMLGIWSKAKAPFVCIEPWLGIADSVDSDQKIENKEAIISLEKGKTFTASYSIEIHL